MLKRCARGTHDSLAHFDNIVPGILSGPDDLVESIDKSELKTCSGVIDTSFKMESVKYRQQGGSPLWQSLLNVD